jgi:hypothetical protein
MVPPHDPSDSQSNNPPVDVGQIAIVLQILTDAASAAASQQVETGTLHSPHFIFPVPMLITFCIW